MLRSKIHIKRKGALFAVLFTSIFALIGLTIAFNSDLKIFGNLFKAGTYEAEYREEFTSPTDWTPCTETPKLVTVKNNSPVNIKVRLKYDEFWRNKTDTQDLPLTKDGTTLAVINFQNEEDWIQHGEWYYYKEDLAPEAVTSSLFKSVTLDCNANLAVEKVCHETPNGTVCEEPDDDDAYDKYHLAVTIQTSDEDFPRTDEHYTVTIDPNGGTYNGSTEVYSESLNYGTVIDLSSAVYVGHDLEYWTYNETDTYTESSITVEDNISLKANWVSSTWHTVTVDPNGGEFEGHTASYDTSIREGTNFTLSSTEPTKEDFLFDGWMVNGVALADYTFPVNEDLTILANWSPIIAQNTRTSKFYRSITAAEAEASSGDTISLLRDTEENFTNTKSITLDLGANTVNGSITNNGTLTLLNGEVNNDAGAAVTNYGTLTMGINDYIDENTVNIENTYVRLVGTDTGLKQNGEFKFYDGYIEGDIALEGGYDDSPFYRKAMDDEIVYYFPFVDKSPDDDDKQRVILENSDLAVSKTKVGGDIYYYSLQDNINTSIRTGYKIYIVREGFSTGEPLTIPENTDIIIDIDGHTFTATDTITANGKLTVEDSKTTVATASGLASASVNGKVFVTPHRTDDNTTTITYAGDIITSQTTIINGELVLNNAKITGATANDTVQNNAILTMQGGVIGSTAGYVIRPTDSTTISIDKNSYLYSTSSNMAAVYIGNQNFIWNEGNIYGAYQAIYADSGSKQDSSQSPVTIQITGGQILSQLTGISGGCSYGSNYCKSRTVTMTGGQIIVNNSSRGHYTYGISGMTAIINTGDTSSPAISVSATQSQATGFNGGTVSISNSNISVNGSQNSGYVNSSYGIYSDNSSTLNISGSVITVNGDSPDSMYGIYKRDGTTNVTDSTITVSSTSTGGSCQNSDRGYTYGIYSTRANMNVKNSSITVSGSSVSTCKRAVGIYIDNSSSAITLEGNNINVSNASSVNYGVYVTSTNVTILSGTIHSENYGVYSSDGRTVTIGKNDGTINKDSPEIIGDAYALYGGDTGYFNYYDGTLRGRTGAYKNNAISAIPDGTTYHIEEAGGYKENCWLIDAENYLQVGETEYNSLRKAYDAITGDSGTIKVIADTTVTATLPGSPAEKVITFDLNGHKLTYTQSLVNNSTMTIVDSDPDKAGKLSNPTANAPAITNNASLTIESGHIYSAYLAIRANNGDLTVNGGIIESADTAIYADSGSKQDSSQSPVTIQITGGQILSQLTGISGGCSYGSNYCKSRTVTMTGGQIIVNNSSRGHYTYGISGMTAIINTGDTSSPAISVSATQSQATGFNGGTVSISNSNISVNGSQNSGYVNSSYGIYSDNSSTLNISGSVITVNGDSPDSMYGIYKRDGTTNVTDSTITVSSTSTGGSCQNSDRGYTYGIYSTRANMNVKNSSITVSGSSVSTCKRAVGIYIDNSSSAITLEGNNINVSNASSVNYGVYVTSTNVTILSGTIHSENYGVYSSDGRTVTIGKNDGTINKDSPEIIGDAYALYGGDTGYFNYYDGTLRGGTGAYRDGAVKAIADNTTIHQESTTIGDRNYESRWLVNSYDVAKKGNTKYQSLSDAIAAASTGDEIELLADNYIFTSLAIPADKEFAVKTNGYKLILSNSITNSGKVFIVNNAVNDPDAAIVKFYSQNYAFINNVGGELSLKNIIFDTDYGINNSGTLSLDNVSIMTAKTAINNSGNIIGQNNINLNGSSYSLYNNGGNSTISNATITGKSIYINEGEVTLTNSSASKNGNSVIDYITNKGTLNLNATSLSLFSTKYNTSSSTTISRTIYNTGTLYISNGSNISHTTSDQNNSIFQAASTIYNDGGSLTAIDSNVTLDTTAMKSYTKYNAYAIYSTTNIAIIESGSVSSRALGPSYGVYTDTGAIILGTPEPSDSPNYGRDTADVSTASPDISAISTSTNNSYKIGIGIKNASGGRVEYYDGVVSGNTAAFAEEPTITEHLYEPCTELNTSVTPNLYTTHLFWMRDGQSSCANN